jgi:pentapeptide MXKDX repeat protein
LPEALPVITFYSPKRHCGRPRCDRCEWNAWRSVEPAGEFSPRRSTGDAQMKQIATLALAALLGSTVFAAALTVTPQTDPSGVQLVQDKMKSEKMSKDDKMKKDSMMKKDDKMKKDEMKKDGMSK